MDLSDNFRKTFTYNLKEKSGEKFGMANSMVPKKVGRFEHYKYRRLLLNNENE